MSEPNHKIGWLEPSIVLTGFLVCISVIHLMFAGLFPLGVDDAHYALYGVIPALSYFDHPPVTGWLMALVAEPGVSEFVIRFVPLLLILITSVLLYKVAQDLFSDVSRWIGVVTVLVFHSAPLIQYFGWSMVPDLPLMPLALLFFLVGVRVSKTGAVADWALLGLIAGLCGLTKYTAVLMPIAFVATLSFYQGLRWLRTPGPWLAGIIAMVVLLPVWLWNLEHDWASLIYQFEHSAGSGWRLSKGLAIIVLQFVVYGPLLFIGGIAGTLSLFRPREGFPVALLLVLAWTILLATVWAAGNGDLMVHWPLVGWLFLSPAAAVWLLSAWRTVKAKVLATVSCIWCLTLTLTVAVVMAFMPLSVVPSLAPAVKDLVGWQEAAEEAQFLLGQMPKLEDRILVSTWTSGSRLAWYAWPVPVQVLSSKASQFDYWYGKAEGSDAGLLVLNEKRPSRTLPETVNRYGFHCVFIKDMLAEADSVAVSRFGFYQCMKAD